MSNSIPHRKRYADLPDFVIAGAMKCASNTLHRALRQHPDIYMPARGMVFFAIDDIEEHPSFFPLTDEGWYSKNYRSHLQEYLGWYRSYYADAEPGQLLGEAAPTYLASQKVPARMAELIPDVKLIFLLRDPVERAYSQYWHEVYNGRAFYSFEDTIRFAQGTIVRRSLYKSQLRRYLDFFPRKNMKFIVFEKFIKNVESTVDDVLEFLNIESPFMLKEKSHHKNKTNIRKYPQLQLIKNRMFREHLPRRYFKFLPNMPPLTKLPADHRLLLKLYNRINPPTGEKAPPMSLDTRRFLSEFYAQENEGLSDLVGVDLAAYWPSFREQTVHQASAGTLAPASEAPMASLSR